MKFLGILLASLLGSIAFAQDEVVVELPSPHYGTYVFQIQNADAGQAVTYIDESRLPHLFVRVANETGPLKAAIEKVYATNGCDPDGSVAGEETFECGQLNSFNTANTILWTYGRGGWMSGDASYRTYLTFTTAGTGHFTQMSMIVESTISVESVNSDDVFNGTALPIFEATYRFEKVHLLDESGNETIVDLQP